jgi:RNA polymerase sigma-70 factor (ECF subfamily)
MRDYDLLTDGELTDLLKSNDRGAFTEIYNRYWKRLFGIAANKIKDLDDAEEIVQDIFVSLWRRRDDLSDIISLSSYLAVSVKYRVIKILEKRCNAQRYVDYAEYVMSMADNSTEEWMEFEELKAQLSQFVAELPAKCQLVFKMSRESGFPQKRIAEELGIAEKTVEAHLGKALKILRTRLSQFLL